MIVTSMYQRRTFRVQAIQVTSQNMGELATWCGGELKLYPPLSDNLSEGRTRRWCVEVVIQRIGGREIKARAYAGDWITRLSDANNYRVYHNKSFLEAFEEIRTEVEKFEAVLRIVRDINRVDRVGDVDWDGIFLDSEEIAKQIMGIFEGVS